MEETYDVAIVGAGAAGLMSAVCAGQEGLKVLLLDGQAKIGAKILMSGGTRCNVTNRVITEKDYSSKEERIVRNILRAYPSRKTVNFFESLGIRFIEEDNNKLFPDTHSGKTILDALVKALGPNVTLKSGHKVTSVSQHHGLFAVEGNGFKYQSKTVVLASGGLSYPKTGSDGVGYAIAKKFGHSMVETSAALTPFLTDDQAWKSITGVALPVRLDLWVDQKKIKSFESPFLFTHFGFSGTACLNMSRHWDRLRDNQTVELRASFLPEQKLEDFRQQLLASHPKKTVKNFLSDIVPERFAAVLLEKCKMDLSVTIAQLTKEKRELLIKNLFDYPLEVKKVFGYDKAEVTAGGIDLVEINDQTMESKCQKGLFFAGEILDVDGRIGGFNFQWAWATGFLAVQGIKRLLAEKHQ